MIEDPSDLEIEDVMAFLQMRKENLGADAVSVTINEGGHYYKATMSEDDDIDTGSTESRPVVDDAIESAERHPPGK